MSAVPTVTTARTVRVPRIPVALCQCCTAVKRRPEHPLLARSACCYRDGPEGRRRPTAALLGGRHPEMTESISEEASSASCGSRRGGRAHFVGWWSLDRADSRGVAAGEFDARVDARRTDRRTAHANDALQMAEPVVKGRPLGVQLIRAVACLRPASKGRRFHTSSSQVHH